MKITEIKKIGRGERYYFFVDQVCQGVIEAEVLAKHNLKTGQEIDQQFLDQLIVENGDYACFNRSLSLLAKVMKTEKQLRDFLKEKKYPEICIDNAIEKLKDYNYINDEVFCENYVGFYLDKKSKRQIKFELMQKGVNSELVDNVVQKLNDESEMKVCLKYAEKFIKNRNIDKKTKQKFYNHLAGKGFDFAVISKVWEEISDDRY